MSNYEWYYYTGLGHELGKAICGVYIHKLEDVNGKQSLKGSNPLASFIPIFESDYSSSKYVYDDIKNNIEKLVEDAIEIRTFYK